MSIVTSSASRYWTFYRRTARLVDEVSASASVSVDRQPRVASHAEVRVAGGTTGSGTVTINGSDSSGATSEVLTFTGNGTQVTTTRWLSISSIDTTGLDDEATVATIEVRAVSADGTSNLLRYAVASGRPVAFSFTGAAKYPALAQGSSELDQAIVLVDYEQVWTPRVGDVAVDDVNSDEWEVRAVREQIVGFGVRPHHYRLTANRLSG